MTDAGRAAWERIRLQAVERFEGEEKNREIAAVLRVSEQSVERWRRQWRETGATGVWSKGSPGHPRLSQSQIARLERELERRPLVHGWADQRWTLARVKTLIGRLFHVSYTVEGTWRLLKRHGWSWQQPARRAIERDDAAVELKNRDGTTRQGPLPASGRGVRTPPVRTARSRCHARPTSRPGRTPQESGGRIEEPARRTAGPACRTGRVQTASALPDRRPADGDPAAPGGPGRAVQSPGAPPRSGSNRPVRIMQLMPGRTWITQLTCGLVSVIRVELARCPHPLDHRR